MGRIRSIKPEILSDGKAARLSDRAWRLWLSMWVLADDAGLLPAESEFLAAQVFWAVRDKSIDKALSELVKNGLIELYVHHEQKYAKITNWLKHQKIDRPSLPKFPIPTETLASPREPSSSMPRALDADGMGGEGISLVLSKPTRERAFDFLAVHAIYPRKRNKAEGLKKLASVIKNQADYDAVLHGARLFAEEVRSKGTEEQFIPLFTTWINQKRWLDYAAESAEPAFTPRHAVKLITLGKEVAEWKTIRANLVATNAPPENIANVDRSIAEINQVITNFERLKNGHE